MNSTTSSRTQMLWAAALMLAVLAFPAEAWASAGGVAGGTFKIIDDMISMLKTLAKPLMVLMIIIGGMTWAFTRNDEGMKTIGRVIIGLSIAIGASGLAAELKFLGSVF